MKNKLFLAGMIGAVLAFALAFSACDNGSGIQTVKRVNVPVIPGVSAVTVTAITDTASNPDVNYYVISWDAVARVPDGRYQVNVQEEGKNTIDWLWEDWTSGSAVAAPQPQNAVVYSIENRALISTPNTNPDKYSVLAKRGLGANIPHNNIGGRIRFGVKVTDYLGNQSALVWSEYKEK
jgi:hypothetical protein